MKDWYEFLKPTGSKTAGLGPDGDMSRVQHQATGMDDFLTGNQGADEGLQALYHDRRSAAPKRETMRVASVSNLQGFTRIASDTLIRHAERDLWSIKEGEDGEFIIDRLFDDDGNPLKV